MDKTARILLKIKNKCMRKLSLIVLLTYCSANIFAQAPDIEWQNTIGGTSADLCYNALATSDGGFLLIGNSNSFISGDKTENNLGIAASYDYWVVKVDASGNVVWDNTIGGYKSDDLRSLIETSDGGYLLGGWSDSDISVDKSENRIGGAGYGDYWVVKLDLDGNILWENTIGGTKSDELYDIEETASGTYILGGTSYSPADFDKTIPSTNHDIWLVEIDNLGTVIWQKVIGGSSTDRFVEMEITSDGGLLIGASSLSGISGDKTEINHGGNDLWVIKLDAARNIQWENSFGGTISDYMRDVIELPEGGYMILGASQSNMSADKSDNAFGVMNYNDFWLIKLDEDGNALWDTIYGGDGEDYPASVMLSTDGNILLLGNSNSQISGNKTTNTYASTYDIWVIKITTTGVKLWEKCMGGDSYDFPAEMVLANDGGVVIASQSYSTVSGDKTEANVGGASSDFWVIKLETDCELTEEVCNEIDDDCNGLIDDGMAMYAVAIPLGPTTVCQGTTVELTSEFSGDVIQWTRNGVNIAGATDINYVANKTGLYACVTTNLCGTATSAAVSVTINKNPSATITAAGPTSFCAGGSVTLNVTPVAGCTYQWYKGAGLLAGATGTAYIATTAGNYKCRVTKTATGCYKNSNTIPVTITCKENNNESQNELTVYPNPANQNIVILTNFIGENAITIIDAVGNNVMQMNTTATLLEINISNLPAGMYSVLLQNTNGQNSTHFIKN